MSKQRNGQQVFCRRYLPKLKGEALGLPDKHVGVASAAKQLCLHESQLHAWRKKARYEANHSE